MDELGVVRAGIPQKDGCQVLARLKAFVVDQGVAGTLEHVFRNREGRVTDLSPLLTSDTSGSSASASTPAAVGSAELRAKEWLAAGYNPIKNPTWIIRAASPDPASGLLRARLPADLVEHAGIYELAWGVRDAAGELVVVDKALLSVERNSLYALSLDTVVREQGPPTLGELRVVAMDADRGENLLLADVEFGDEQILTALMLPVQEWNETPPPIEKFTTRDFPFRGAWLNAALGHLHLIAANHYRRNRLQHQAGGVAIDDKGKEPNYLAEGQRRLAEFKQWLVAKKKEINVHKVWGSKSSAYTSRTGW